ncbi:MFS transporter [Planotetraspora thailandica]|uniref:MFS transporter n=1 Tax=Planotetraspora thailandica TaxID=487172 RepID=A0A8J3V177_9ACTN|nr:MFS transporter [Planotetraspora thailandica]GII53652.1 MFS transporter [Planotetraspora thailandica]
MAQAVQIPHDARRTGLWHRDFALYFAGRAISILGDAMLPVAVSLGVLGAGYGPTGVGFVLAAWMAPVGGLILFGGVFADRFTARRMMIGADLVRVVTQSIIAVAFLTGRPSLVLLIVLSALSGAAAAMFQPGVSSMVPHIAHDVQRANATLRVADAIAQLFGPTLSALLVTFGGAGVVYGFNAATFAVSAVCLLSLRVRPPASLARGTSMVRNLREGWTEFRSRTWMWSVILVWVFYGVFVFGPVTPLGAAVLTQDLGSKTYGLIMSAAGAGTVIGGVIAMWFKPARPLAVGAVVMTVFFLEPLVIAMHMPAGVVAAGFAVSGAAWAFWSVMWATSIQTKVTPDVLNRVTAYEVGGSVLSIPIGQALSGPVAARVGADHVLLFGFAVGIAGIVCLLSLPAVRGLRRT